MGFNLRSLGPPAISPIMFVFTLCHRDSEDAYFAVQFDLESLDITKQKLLCRGFDTAFRFTHYGRRWNFEILLNTNVSKNFVWL